MQISLFQEHLCDVQPILPNSHMLSPPGGADLQKQGGDRIVKQIHILSIDNCVCQALNQLYIFKFAYKLKKCMSYWLKSINIGPLKLWRGIELYFLKLVIERT